MGGFLLGCGGSSVGGGCDLKRTPVIRQTITNHPHRTIPKLRRIPLRHVPILSKQIGTKPSMLQYHHCKRLVPQHNPQHKQNNLAYDPDKPDQEKPRPLQAKILTRIKTACFPGECRGNKHTIFCYPGWLLMKPNLNLNPTSSCRQ